MQYPQAYLFIKNEGKPLDLKWLRGLANNTQIYVPKQSRCNGEMNLLSDVMKQAASIVSKESLWDDISTVVIPYGAMNEFILVAVREKLVSICWLDDEASVDKIDALVDGYYMADTIPNHACDLLDSYHGALAHALKYLPSKPLSDEHLLQNVVVLADRATELQDSIRLALKAAVRQGIVNRIDLQ